MKVTDHELDVVVGNNMTSEQEAFINHWSQHYFGAVAVSRGLSKAPVHWRLILRSKQQQLSHVALTEMDIEIDGVSKTVGAIGGLFTPSSLQNNGYGNALMDEAEVFIFDRLKLPSAILFCLDELVPFYARRRWSLLTLPVTLQQKDGVTIWGASVMVLTPEGDSQQHLLIHVPSQNRKQQSEQDAPSNGG